MPLLIFGIEMFVLDDGWFGNKYPRDDDRCGLGDWQVNKKKTSRRDRSFSRLCT
ncbi:alpha-galactosidase [Bacteroides nordii]|uniref:alpha-galactosidase n=1 Tax=Bacteroides nordii TaxID=291645 RepID=UPI00351FD611